jgi:hypothetical protein
MNLIWIATFALAKANWGPGLPHQIGFDAQEHGCDSGAELIERLIQREAIPRGSRAHDCLHLSGGTRCGSGLWKDGGVVRMRM